jgi:hypothetical protein
MLTKVAEIKLPSDEKYILDLIQPNLETGPWIAGGAVLRWLENKPLGHHDVDVFCKDHQQFLKIVERLENESENRSKSLNTNKKHELFDAVLGLENSNISVSVCHKSYDTKNAETWNITSLCQDANLPFTKCQLIKKTYPSLREIFNNFDIRVCRMATDGHAVMAAPDSWQDFQNKKLNISLPARPHCIQRIVKYMCYGYEPDWDIINQIIESNEYPEISVPDEYISV